MKKNYLIALTGLFALGAGTLASCTEPEPSKTYYTVSFDADGGSPTPSAQKVKAGEPATSPTTAPTKTGYAFLFWRHSGSPTSYNFQAPVNSNLTLTAKWEEESKVEYWHVTWNLNGGAWAAGDNHATQVVKGGTLAEPAAPTKANSTFEGWYGESTLTTKITFPYDTSTLTADFTLYAKWKPEGGGEEEKEGFYIGETRYGSLLSAIQAATGTTAVITVWTNTSLTTTCYDIPENTHITIEGKGSGERIIVHGSTISSSSAFFAINSGASLTLENITLDGKATDNSMIYIKGGSFTMLEGAKITGSKNNGGSGGGVNLSSGNFTMKGGSIAGNTVTATVMRTGQGGGVWMDGGTFVMEGGEITGNTASYVGGLYVRGGDFIMKGGKIHSNVATVTGNSQNLGLYVYNGVPQGSAVYGNGDPILEPGGSGTDEDITGKDGAD